MPFCLVLFMLPVLLLVVPLLWVFVGLPGRSSHSIGAIVAVSCIFAICVVLCRWSCIVAICVVLCHFKARGNRCR